jgi:3-oxoacyl-[acyl-carrier protein] reductase
MSLAGKIALVTGASMPKGIGLTSADASSLLKPEALEKVEKRTAIGRSADPQEIADALAYVVSDKARYMTGAVVNMLGGLDLFVF